MNVHVANASTLFYTPYSDDETLSTATYRARVKGGQENPKNVKDLYYHLSHYVFDGVRNVNECRYIVKCLAGYKEEHDSRSLPHRSSASDQNGNNQSSYDGMNVDGMAADELEEYRFWTEMDALSNSIQHYHIDGSNAQQSKSNNIEALLKFEEILSRIDAGVNNWARMKNYFNESDNLQQLCLTEIQWKLCIDKFSNKNDASKMLPC
jgi:hypothetical protein